MMLLIPYITYAWWCPRCNAEGWGWYKNRNKFNSCPKCHKPRQPFGRN